MNPILILALLEAIPAIIQFIEWLIANHKKPTAAERLHLASQREQLQRARRWMRVRQRARADKAIRRIDDYLASLAI